ncbi:MAG: endonuclease/exonuclease/phosphatase family protein [Thermoguttaceae bacterium]|jgi:endonuclease/exonuclease/phosphatase (EEP) superfamily protein YafD|nr:endonuclease/exonuclease/phosphatase family protein [Thermoguttaceae bacterium]
MEKEPSGFFRLHIQPWGLLTAAGAVACAATLLGFLGRFWWFFDLFTHFPVQYLLGLTALGAVLIVGRRKAGVVLFAFACVNLMLVLPTYFGGQKAPPAGTPTLRAMLLNVNTRFGDPQRVKQVVRDTAPDILVLEEISAQWMRQLDWLRDSHPYVLAEQREDNFGIGLFSKLPLVESEVVYIGSADVPSILATIDTGQANLRVIATHPLPPIGREYARWRNEQLQRLPNHIDASEPTILLGDLNVTPWSCHFRRLLKRSGLLDSSRGYGVQGSWPNFVPSPLRIPIDHVLHSPAVVIVNRAIGPDVNSDHLPVIVDFAILVRSAGTH